MQIFPITADHDALLNFVADEHIDWTDTTEDLETTGSGTFGSLHADTLRLDADTLSSAVGKIILAPNPGSDLLISTSAGGKIDLRSSHIYTTGAADISIEENLVVDGTVTWTGGSSDQANIAYDHAIVPGGDSVHVSVAENTAWDAAYTHSQVAGDDGIHGTNYLKDNANDQTNYSLRMAGLGVGRPAVAGLIDCQRSMGATDDAYYSTARYYTTTTGTPESGIGAAFSMLTESLGGTSKYTGLFAGTFYDVTGGAEIGELIIQPSYHASSAAVPAASLKVRSVAADEVLVHIPKGNLEVTNGNLDVGGSSTLGDGGTTNYLGVSATGIVSLAGSAKRDLTLRPDIDYSAITAQGKPTRVTYGAFQGFSLPLYAVDEEIFLGLNVPGRWDGASDITAGILVCLSGAETADDDFRLQLSWENSEVGEPIVNTVHDVEVQTNTPAGRNDAYDTYMVSFTIDYDADAGHPILAHDLLSMRLRRVDVVAGTEIAGEVIVLDAHLHFTVDKMFKAPD